MTNFILNRLHLIYCITDPFYKSLALVDLAAEVGDQEMSLALLVISEISADRYKAQALIAYAGGIRLKEQANIALKIAGEIRDSFYKCETAIAFLAYPIYEPDQILSIIASIEDSFYKQDALEKFAAALPKLTPSQSFPLTGWCR